jgi:hypothetical protein
MAEKINLSFRSLEVNFKKEVCKNADGMAKII